MSLNKVQLIGNVGKDPDVRYLDSGIAVATFPLATTERGYTLANGTQVPERTEWHNIVLWRGLAETAEKYIHKGDKLYIEIFGDNMEMLTPRSVQSGQPQPMVPNQQPAVSEQPAQQTNAADDLPF